MKNIIASIFTLAILTSCATEPVETTVEETVDTTVFVEEVVEVEGEESTAE